jgi:hypothetical protein
MINVMGIIKMINAMRSNDNHYRDNGTDNDKNDKGNKY